MTITRIDDGAVHAADAPSDHPRTDRVDDTGIHQFVWDYMAATAETMRTMPPLDVPAMSEERAIAMVEAMHAEHAVTIAVAEARTATLN